MQYNKDIKKDTRGMITNLKIFLALLIGIILWFCPLPNGLSANAWHMFAIFSATILLVVTDALPMAPATLFGLSAMVITKTTSYQVAFSGYSHEVVWLVFVAFFIANGFVNTGLAKRIAYLFVKFFGKSSLGLAYGLCFAEACLAPAIPSVTARSGAIIYPIIESLSKNFGSFANDKTSKKIGSYLMLVSFQASTVTSAMFLTAMAGNPMAVKLAQNSGINLNWGNWALYAAVPAICSLILIPIFIYRLNPPELKNTPDAPKIAQKFLDEMGSLSKSEWIMFITFILLLLLWIFGAKFGISAISAALLGFAILVIAKILKWEDILGVRAAFDTFIWFGAFVAMADAMNSTGLTVWFGTNASILMGGFHWTIAALAIIFVYFYVHYFFASSTAHIGALYSPFLITALNLKVPALPMALGLAYASSLYGGLTHYGFGSAPILFGAGFVDLKTWWKIGFFVSILNLLIWICVGSVWWSWLGIN